MKRNIKYPPSFCLNIFKHATTVSAAYKMSKAHTPQQKTQVLQMPLELLWQAQEFIKEITADACLFTCNASDALLSYRIEPFIGA